MCALNIRWGNKGSIQEFSTLLQAPAPQPPRLLQEHWEPGLCETDTLRTPTTTTQTATGSSAGDKTVNDSQNGALSTTFGLQPLQAKASPPCCCSCFSSRFLPKKPKLSWWERPSPFHQMYILDPLTFSSQPITPRPLHLKFLTSPPFWYSPSFSFYAPSHVTWLCVAKVTDGFHFHQSFSLQTAIKWTWPNKAARFKAANGHITIIGYKDQPFAFYCLTTDWRNDRIINNINKKKTREYSCSF